MWELAEERCTGCGICVRVCPESEEVAERLRSLLGLTRRPVGIRLIAADGELPKDVPEAPAPLRHCQAVHIASEGGVLLIPVEKQTCFAARAALGMAPLPEKVASGEVPYLHGLARNQQAARIMAEIPKLPPGSIRAEVVGALDRMPLEPDVVVLVVTPFQAMWIVNAFLYDRGGPRLTANFAGMQASCGDATVIPYRTGKVDFSVGCYGCRSAGGLAPEEMYVGLPRADLDQLIGAMERLKRAMRKFGAHDQKEVKVV